MRVLTFNIGSSSLKFGIFEVAPSGATIGLASGMAEALGTGKSRLVVQPAPQGKPVEESLPLPDHRAAFLQLGCWFDGKRLPPPEAVGHRIVHGGESVRHHVLIDDAVLAQLEAATPLAPLHTPAALAGVRFAREHFAGLPQVACLDTAFHATMPDVAQTLPIDHSWREAGVKRYGFHGLSCESILHQLGASLPPRLVIAHLGNGASVTAVLEGHSIDNSMGFTPSGGLMMATRCGDIDPGVLIYLLREHGFDAARLEQLTDHRSGLLGVSALSGDMRVLREAMATHAQASLAVRMFGYAVRRQVAAMAAALQGIDMLVFTGGIGEHDAATRADVCAGLRWLGVVLDPARNAEGAGELETAESSCRVAVLPAQEDEQIARHSFDVIRRGTRPVVH